MKVMMKEVLSEMIMQKKDVFYGIVLEALEEVGLAKAIDVGRKNEFVEEDSIFGLLDGER